MIFINPNEAKQFLKQANAKHFFMDIGNDWLHLFYQINDLFIKESIPRDGKAEYQVMSKEEYLQSTLSK